MSRNQFEYYPASAPNTATRIFNVSTSNTITVIVAEKDAFANTYKVVDAFIPTNNNYYKFLDYCKEYDETTGVSSLNLFANLANPPDEISRYLIYVKESIVEADVYDITSISIPNYIIDAQGNITVGTPTVQTVKTLKPKRYLWGNTSFLAVSCIGVLNYTQARTKPGQAKPP